MIAWLKKLPNPKQLSIVYYIHSNIQKFSRLNTGFCSLYKCFIDPVLSWFEESCFSLSWNLTGYFKHWPWSLICCLFKSSYLIGWKKDASTKWWDSWINHTFESQSDCKDHQCFQNGCNKCLYYATTVISPNKVMRKRRICHALTLWNSWANIRSHEVASLNDPNYVFVSFVRADF